MSDTTDLDQLARDAIESLRAARAALEAYESARGRNPSVFGDEITHALNHVFTQRASYYPALFGLPKRPDRQTQFIRSCEERVDNARRMLAELKGKKGLPFTLKHRPVEPSGEDVEKAEERLNDAELQLARAKGLTGDLEAQKKAERLAKAKADRLEFAEGVASTQARAKARNAGAD